MRFTVCPGRAESPLNHRRWSRPRERTERRHLHAQLLQAQKPESIGQLAAGIAHEINTPTQYIGDNVRFLADAFADTARLQRAYAELHRAARAGSVERGLLDELDAALREADRW